MVTTIAEMVWRMVYIFQYFKAYAIDRFIKPNLFGDGRCGLFGILDGHGGHKVSRFCTKSIPEVLYRNGNSCLKCIELLEVI